MRSEVSVDAAPDSGQRPAELGRAGDAYGAVRLLVPGGPKGWLTEVKIDRQAFLAAKCTSQAVDLIRAQLRRAPVTLSGGGAWHLSIPPVGSNGFAIDLCKDVDGQISCLFGPLEETFEDIDMAMTWIGRALSSTYQLRTTSFGSHISECFLEPLEPEHARLSLAGGHGTHWLRLRKAKQTVIRSNAFAPD
jgi:hypothetical protein